VPRLNAGADAISVQQVALENALSKAALTNVTRYLPPLAKWTVFKA
jgi:hypothetical protein